MARVTVEDIIEYIPNRFEIVILGSCRARQIENGSKSFIEDSTKKDKSPVTSLRELATNKLDLEDLVKSLSNSKR